MTESEKKSLQITACKVRKGIVTATHAAKSGHPGGSLSAADMFTYLYFKELNVDPANPKWADRDRFVLSKGHTAPGLYSTLAQRGFFPVEELTTLRHIGSRLQGHPNMNETPGVDMSTGSLGQGVSCAAGMALSAKKMGKELRVYTLLGDGEIEEGQVWEALMFAHQHKLDNLCVIVDNNGLQIDGRIEEVMSPYPIVDKLQSLRPAHHRDQRPRLRPDRGRLRGGARHEGRAHRDRDEDHQGQGRQLHGEQGGLARQGPERRGTGDRSERAGRHSGGTGGLIQWRN